MGERFKPTPPTLKTNGPENGQVKIEVHEWIEKFLAEIKAGRAGFGFSGKINTNIISKDGKTHVPTREFMMIGYEGTNSKGLEIAVLNSDRSQKFLSYEEDIFLGKMGKDSSMDLISVSTAFSKAAEGTRQEEYEEIVKGFLGREKRVKKTREVPNVVQRPALLAEIISNGSRERAYIINLRGESGTIDHFGRPSRSQFIFVVSIKIVEEIFGTKEKPGGLLRKYPDLLIKAIQAEAPELWEDFKKGSKNNHRKAFVLADNFSDAALDNSPTYPQLASKLSSGELSQNIIEYSI